MSAADDAVAAMSAYSTADSVYIHASLEEGLICLKRRYFAIMRNLADAAAEGGDREMTADAIAAANTWYATVRRWMRERLP